MIFFYWWCNFKYINFILMRSKFLSRFAIFRFRRTTILLLLIGIVFIISLFIMDGPTLNGLIRFIEFALLFYTLLHPWEKKSRYYYGILLGISLILFLLLVFLMPHIPVKVWSKVSEDIPWNIGFICVTGFFAGLIGLIL